MLIKLCYLNVIYYLNVKLKIVEKKQTPKVLFIVHTSMIMVSDMCVCVYVYVLLLRRNRHRMYLFIYLLCIQRRWWVVTLVGVCMYVCMYDCGKETDIECIMYTRKMCFKCVCMYVCMYIKNS